MAFPIIPKKRSGATGNPSTLELGELATNTQTGELFLGGDGGVMLLNPPTAAGTTVTEHTGDGTTVAFTFTGYSTTDDGAYIVSVGGIDQPPSKYSVSATAGGTITFVEAPIAGELISIRAIVAGGGGGGGGITALTGDVSASGTGSVSATVTHIQGIEISTTDPTGGQSLIYNSATGKWTPQTLPFYSVEVLLVAGGGSGGGAGGGGAGGVKITSIGVINGQDYPLIIGAGGGQLSGGLQGAGNNGGNTSGFGVTVLGGGGGGGWASSGSMDGNSGGSGGGAGLTFTENTNAGGAGTTGQGFAGGSANDYVTNGWAAAGGGGAGSVGADKNGTTAGNGGDGVQSDITGTALYWAGGGGGGAQNTGTTAGNGGLGGGGGGGVYNDATPGLGDTSGLTPGENGSVGIGGNGGANTGGGGGGMGISVFTSGSGGSGIVVVSYLGAQRGTGGTVTSVGGKTIHTFTSSGTFTA